MKIKMLMLAVGLLFLSGCAGTKKQMLNEIRVVIENSIIMDEPCNFTCGKIKGVINKYKEKLGGDSK